MLNLGTVKPSTVIIVFNGKSLLIIVVFVPFESWAMTYECTNAGCTYTSESHTRANIHVGMCEALNQVNERCITAIAEVETANDAVRRSGRVSVPSRRATECYHQELPKNRTEHT